METNFETEKTRKIAGICGLDKAFVLFTLTLLIKTGNPKKHIKKA